MVQEKVVWYRKPVPTRYPQPLSQGLRPCQLPLHRGAKGLGYPLTQGSQGMRGGGAVPPGVSAETPAIRGACQKSAAVL